MEVGQPNSKLGKQSASSATDTTAAERTIDRLVCDLYGLTDEERRAIGFVEIT